MIYGLCGVHGSGKTTLGKQIAEAMEISFIQTSTTEVAREMGYDPVQIRTLEERIAFQEALLEHHVQRLAVIPRPAILDRTPIDMATYMLAEFGMHSGEAVSPELLERVCTYVERALRFTAINYDFVFQIGPLPVYEVSPHRPAHNPAYHRHYDLLMRGLMSTLKGKASYAYILTTDPQRRVEYILDMIERRLNKHDGDRKKARVN